MSNHWQILPPDMLELVARSRQRTLELYKQIGPKRLRETFSEEEIQRTESDAIAANLELARRREVNKQK